jgi:hypothetical protein
MRRVPVLHRFGLSALLLVTVLVLTDSEGAQSHAASPGQALQPQTATDWFRRADDLTNLRVPGSAPFHMKVTFHAWPGEDFVQPGQSPILTGDGSYDEIWLSPEKWRREVTLGSYHAIEVWANGVRKFRASSDYEPSRVLMLLDALLDTVPRNFLFPELERAEPKWKLHRGNAGDAQVVLLRFNRNSEYIIPASSTYEFSFDGLLLRASSAGLTMVWQDRKSSGGKWFPRTFPSEPGTITSSRRASRLARPAPQTLGRFSFPAKPRIPVRRSARCSTTKSSPLPSFPRRCRCFLSPKPESWAARLSTGTAFPARSKLSAMSIAASEKTG